MDKIVKDLKLPQIEILPDSSIRRELQQKIDAGDQSIELVLLKRYDYPKTYRTEAYRKARDLLYFRYADIIKAHTDHFNSFFKPGSPRILIINREKPDDFYASKKSEVKTAGSDRRSIPNFGELVDALSKDFGNVMPVSLEGKSLLYQIALFSSVDLVVCQHGAAFANLIWGRPGMRVVEIMPADVEKQLSYNPFGRLTPCVGADYWRLSQISSHAPVDPKALAAVVAEALSGRVPGASLWPGFNKPATFGVKSSFNSWLGEGWIEPLQPGAWSVGPVAVLRLPVPKTEAPTVRLVATAVASLGPHRDRQDVRIVVNGVPVGIWNFAAGEDVAVRAVEFPAAVINDGGQSARVEFHVADWRSPLEMGASKDDKELGINLRSIKIQEMTQVRAVGTDIPKKAAAVLGAGRLLAPRRRAVHPAMG